MSFTLKSLEPNIWINFPEIASNKNIITTGVRGVVALPIALSWGDSGTVIEMNSESDLREYFGMNIIPKEIILSFVNAQKLLLVNLNTGGTKASVDLGNSITATAKHNGSLGNNLKIVTTLLPPTNDKDNMRIDIYMDYNRVVSEVTNDVKNFPDNKFIVFTGDGLPTQTVGKNLSGGTDGDVTNENVTKALETLSKYNFNTMPVYSTNEETIKTFIAFASKKAEEKSPFILVVPKYKANNPMVINVSNGVVIDGVEYKAIDMACWVAGLQAGIEMGSDATAMTVPNATDICDDDGNSDSDSSIRDGKFVFVKKMEKVRVLMDINSYTDYLSFPKGDERTQVAELNKYNRVIRTKQHITFSLAMIWENFLDSNKNLSEEQQIDFIKRELITFFRGLERDNMINVWQEETLIVKRMDKVNNTLEGSTEISFTDKFLYFIFDIELSRR